MLTALGIKPKTIFSVITMVCLMSGCRVEISVPEGGEVTSLSGTISCKETQVCMVNVVDLVFDETLIATAKNGFSFTGWKQRERGLCGGSLSACRLVTSSFEGNELLVSFLEGDEVFFLEPVFEATKAFNSSQIESIGSYATRRAVSDTGINNIDSLVDVWRAELNGDDHLDLVLLGGVFPPSPRNGAWPGLILINNGDNSFRVAEGDRPANEWSSTVVVEDFNGDGRTDLFIGDFGYDGEPFPGFPNQLLINTEDGFDDRSVTLPDLDDRAHNVASGDLDSDGDIDLIIVSADFGNDPGRPYALINDGEAHFSLNREILPSLWLDGWVDSPPGFEQFKVPDWPVIFSTFAGELTDLDGDGYEDLVLGQGGWPGAVASRIHWNMGGHFTNEDITFLPDLNPLFDRTIAQTAHVVMGDVDGDDRSDIIIFAYGTNFQGQAVQLLMNKGNRVFVDESDERLGPLRVSQELGLPIYSLIDANNDSALDLVAMSTPLTGEVDSVAVWLNRGDGFFAPIRAFEFYEQKTDDMFFADDSLGQTPMPSSQGLFFVGFELTFPGDGQSTVNINLLEQLTPIVVTDQN
ncbi:MAG: VCBS repeat-containing protein [Pseudomonadota bacterium]